MEIKPGWELASDNESSSSFACNYGGFSSQKLLINRGVIEKFLRIAAIDGQVILGENKDRNLQSAPDINSDGSVTGKGRIRWGEIIQTNKEPKAKVLKVSASKGNWLVDINGDLIRDNLIKKTQLGAREIEGKFADKMDGLVKLGLASVLVKDKLTFKGDPFFTGRIFATYVIFNDYLRLATDFREEYLIPNLVSLGFDFGLLYLSNRLNRRNNDEFFRMMKGNSYQPIFSHFGKLINFHRRSNNNLAEALSIPFELDRFAYSVGYLAYKGIKDGPLIKLAD